MNAEERIDEAVQRWKGYPWQMVYLFAIVVALLAMRLALMSYQNCRAEIASDLIAFGLMHIFASDVLSAGYSLNRIIIPFAPMPSPKIIRIIGFLVLAFGVIISLSQFV
jgi:hypothetical protein